MAVNIADLLETLHKENLFPGNDPCSCGGHITEYGKTHTSDCSVMVIHDLRVYCGRAARAIDQLQQERDKHRECWVVYKKRMDTAESTLAQSVSNRNGNFLDAFGACKVCDGEIPDGHTDNCDIWKLEQQLNAIAEIVNHSSFSSRPLALTVKDIVDAADRMRAMPSFNEQQWAAMQAYDTVRHTWTKEQISAMRAEAERLLAKGKDLPQLTSCPRCGFAASCDSCKLYGPPRTPA